VPDHRKPEKPFLKSKRGDGEMFSSLRISLAKTVSLSQWDKVILTLVATSSLPLLLHALPSGLGESLGPSWLPIFYAPLVAALIFRPHVSLIACLLAPAINHALFQMPSTQVLPFLTFELLIFNATMAFIKSRFHTAGWQVVPAYFATLFLALLAFGHFSGQEIGAAFIRSASTSAPGLVVLVAIAELIGRIQKRQKA
jgi:hypothetical protein